MKLGIYLFCVEKSLKYFKVLFGQMRCKRSAFWSLNTADRKLERLGNRGKGQAAK